MLGRGGTIGILGGGQLGRMMAMSAAQLGYRCIAYAPEGDNVVSQVCDDVFHNKWTTPRRSPPLPHNAMW